MVQALSKPRAVKRNPGKRKAEDFPIEQESDDLGFDEEDLRPKTEREVEISSESESDPEERQRQADQASFFLPDTKTINR